MSDGVACGLNFRESNNTLGYHWAGSGQSWSWDSNLEVPADKWSHVAIVVSPTSLKLYLNGKEATHTIAHPAVTINAMRIGSYLGWQARNYNGLIDEVCIWNRSLSLDEIRALRHLTKKPSDDPDLLLYYQFNEEKSLIYDKANTFDGVLNGNATRVRSRAPVGSGVSASRDILLPGTYTFGETGLTLTYGLGATVPLGKVYATRLRTIPDTLASGVVPYMRGYWILNNYGTVQILSAPSALALDNIALVTNHMRDSLANSIFGRGANLELNGWALVGSNGSEEAGLLGEILYNTLNPGFTSLGQIVVVRDSMRFGRPQVAIVHESDTTVTRRGASSAALGMQTAGKGLLLPQYTTTAVEQIPSPAIGSVVFLTDAREIVCYDGAEWQIMRSSYLEPPVYAGLPEVSGVSLAGGSNASALLSLGAESGVLILPVLDADGLVTMDFPKEGLLVFRSDLNCFSFYDGIDWTHVSYGPSSIASSQDTPVQSLPGMRIGTGTKDPNALLHIIDSVRGFAIPVTRCSEVLIPQAGLIIFDPDMKSIVLFDGVGWKMVK
jgi:hypothetical protein